MESGESPGAAPDPDPDLVDALVEQLQALAPAPAPPAPAEEEEERRRDWAGGLPAEVLAKIAAAVPRRRRRPIHRASDAWDRGSALLAITCKGWKDALKQNAVARAGGPEVWRDWGNRFGEGLPAEVLAKIAETHAEADWAAGLKRKNPDWWTEERIQEETAKGNCLFVFAMVGKAWRKAQLAVGGRLCTRVESDVIFPGSVALVKWALAEGCPRVRGSQTMAQAAAFHGHLGLVQWLCVEGGFAMDVRVMNYAASSGNLELVQWLWGGACPLSVDACAFAALEGHLMVLRWLRAQGAPWCATTCEWAARGGSREVLQWARENGCEWDKKCCWQAAMGGHLEVLQWLRAEGCPWSYLTCYWAVNKGHVEVLRWARENGCVWDAETQDRAATVLGYTDDLGNLIEHLALPQAW